MRMHKVIQMTGIDKLATGYDHYVSIDWSLNTMAVAHMRQRDNVPRVFERPNELKELKREIDGIGSIGAVKIVACVVDARRFAHSGKYMS